MEQPQVVRFRSTLVRAAEVALASSLILGLGGCSNGQSANGTDASGISQDGVNQLGGRGLWPSNADLPGTESPEAVAAAFVDVFAPEGQQLDAHADRAAGPTDPNWVEILSEGSTVTRILAVPDSAGRWTILQVGDGSLSVGPGQQVSFASHQDAAYGVLTFGEDGDSERLDQSVVRGGVYESDEPFGRPIVVALYDAKDRLVTIQGTS